MPSWPVQCGSPSEPAVPASGPVGTAEAQPPSEVRASTKRRPFPWNLEKLGHSDAKDFKVIKAIEEHCDVAAIEEVMQKGRGQPGYELMTTLGERWRSLARAEPGTTGRVSTPSSR